MRYYKVQEGHELRHPDGTVTKGGDVVALATDSADKRTRKGALAVLSGNWEIVSEASAPEAPAPEAVIGAPKKSAKKAKKSTTYKTRETKPEA
tara:strand:- start:32364 stop:32642 length:279 start_codon:yes stop_codon:yes gene_type:complete